MAVSAPSKLDLARRGDGDSPASCDGKIITVRPGRLMAWRTDTRETMNDASGLTITKRPGANDHVDMDVAIRRSAECRCTIRPNDADQVPGGQLVFSDGSTAAFGELANDGKMPTTVAFAAKQVRWMRVEIGKVSATTKNAGLAEIAVFK